MSAVSQQKPTGKQTIPMASDFGMVCSRILGESIFNETVNLMLGLSAPGRGGSYLATRPVKFGSSSVLLWKQNPRGRGEKDSSQKAGWGPRWERRGRGPALDGQERTF
ncbi:transmembrane protein 170B isoform X3 [Moschus berezovskii]|uniref:transmembrane protein 170B isoform X3 n=1 Tax=Moschus berezovskii TaxID=68408 RepID=UPI0024437ED1|nr:transmembrane protein 170B isoform X3 [Moschus berezovskii]